jgi:hypothetical protein
MMDYVVPGRLASMFPDVKLIALLRHPIDRALSHHQMIARWGKEPESFAQAVERLSPEERAREYRLLPAGIESESKGYLVWGEYGRILAGFQQHFDPARILVEFTDDLAANPLQLVGRVLDFLGVDSGYSPPNIGKRYHEGGSRKRIQGLYRVLSAPGFRHAWARIPGKYQRRLVFRYRQWNRIKDEEPASIDQQTRERLIDYFGPDMDLLKCTVHRELLWAEWRAAYPVRTEVNGNHLA